VLRLCSPGNDSVAEYMKQIEQRVGDSKLSDYLDWALGQAEKEIPQPVTYDPVKTVLHTLLDADLSQIPIASEISDMIGCGDVADFPLAEDASRSFVVTPDPYALDDEAYADDTKELPSSADGGPDFHPCFLALSAPTPAHAEPAPAEPAIKRVALPKVVLQLGKLKVKDLRSDVVRDEGQPRETPDDPKLRPYEDTGYVAVVDVLDAARGVWLVFNRHPYTEEGERLSLSADKEEPLLPSLKKAFEIALLLPALKDWVGGKLRMADLEKSLADTASSVALTPTSVTEDAVKTAFGALHSGSSGVIHAA
jgi:hypothetical protein